MPAGRMQLLGVGVGASGPNFATSLVGYWRLNEASGAAVDSSGNSRDLTDTNTVASGTGIVTATARDFENDNSEYFTRADAAAFDVGAMSWSVCGWLNLESIPSFRRVIIGKFDENGASGAGLGYRLRINADPNLYIEVRDGTTTKVVEHAAVLSTATWYFGAAGWDASLGQAWVSLNAGAKTLGTVGSINHPDDAYAFRIGRSTNGSAGTYWDGLLEQWGLWVDRVLSDSELTYIYNGGSGRMLF